mgnify:CR=1 FL=1
MKKQLILSFILFVSALSLCAQEKDPQKLHSTAKNFMRSGDMGNAIIVLRRGLELNPGNLEMLKDLAYAQFLNKDYASAQKTAQPLTDRKDADVACYQILAMIYRSLDEKKESEKLYRSGMKRFPSSGVLFNEYGELLWDREEPAEAIKYWEKGIAADPNYPSNYYHAARYYFFSTEKLWGLLYGEIFINLESYTQRTVEIKKLLLDGYKKLFSGSALLKDEPAKNPFTQAVLSLYQQQSPQMNQGLSIETITVLQTRFILEWFTKFSGKYPYRLFDHQRQLLKLGLFDAYLQWIYGPVVSLTAFEEWTKSHATEYQDFLRLQQNRLFKIPAGQYYKSLTK